MIEKPIMRKITSIKKLSPCERTRLKRLNERFRGEGMIPLGTSRFEIKYLYRLERGRRRYQWRKRPSIFERKEWEEAKNSADPSCDQMIEEILASMGRKKGEQSEVAVE